MREFPRRVAITGKRIDVVGAGDLRVGVAEPAAEYQVPGVKGVSLGRAGIELDATPQVEPAVAQSQS